MKRILITGGAGFVGRRFCKHFLDAGDEVVCVDPIAEFTGGIDPSDGWPLFAPMDYDNFIFVRADCRDWFRENPKEPFDCAVHLAAMVGGRVMIETRPLAVAVDLAIDAEYWQWAQLARPERTLCFSSSAAYPIKYQGVRDYRLLEEDMISFEEDLGMPDMSYGWAKLTCEYLARLAWEKHGLKSICFRPFSGYGEDQDETYPFPSIVKRAMESVGSERLTVWGTGDQMRDFIHVDDCVAGALLTMDRISDGGALNLSTGRYTSFKEFARMAAGALGYEPEVSGLSDKPSGVFARAGDVAKQRSLGFTPAISFEEGIARAIEYFRKQQSPVR